MHVIEIGNRDPEMNWKADEWFTKHHYNKLSEDFKKWWIAFYGESTCYVNESEEQQEYWRRCAFALAGWNARDK